MTSRSADTRRQLSKYVLVGMMANVSLYVVYLLLTSLNLDPKLAMTIAYAIGVTGTFHLNRGWTFSDTSHQGFALVRYLLTYATGYLINYVALLILVDRLAYPHEYIQAGMGILLAVFLFLMQKYWVFKGGDGAHRPESGSESSGGAQT